MKSCLFFFSRYNQITFFFLLQFLTSIYCKYADNSSSLPTGLSTLQVSERLVVGLCYTLRIVHLICIYSASENEGGSRQFIWQRRVPVRELFNFLGLIGGRLSVSGRNRFYAGVEKHEKLSRITVSAVSFMRSQIAGLQYHVCHSNIGRSMKRYWRTLYPSQPSLGLASANQ